MKYMQYGLVIRGQDRKWGQLAFISPFPVDARLTFHYVSFLLSLLPYLEWKIAED